LTTKTDTDSPESGQYWIKSGALTLLERGSGLLFALGSSVILLRHLSKLDYAAWGMFVLISYFLEMGRMGLLQNGLVRFLATNRDEPEEYAKITTAALLLNLLYGLLSIALLWMSLGWITSTWHLPQLAYLLPIYYIINVVMVWFYHCNFIQQANFEFRGIFWSTFFYRGAKFFWVCICIVVQREIQLSEIVLAELFGVVLGALATWRYALPFLRHNWYISWNWVRQLLSYGKFVLGTNLGTMFYKNIDKLTLGHLLGPAAFALYDVAGKVTQMIEAPSFSIASVVFPQSARRMEEQGSAGVGALYELSVAAILAIILPMLCVIFVFSKTIIVLFAGEAYAESAGVLRLTAFFGLFMPFAVQFGTMLDSTGKPALNFAVTFFTAVLNLVLAYVFVLKFGLYGAAIAILIGYLISFVVMQYIMSRQYGVRWWRPFALLPYFYQLGFSFILRKLNSLSFFKSRTALMI
jgi:O-antigen/teichoic acid export membrane protein